MALKAQIGSFTSRVDYNKNVTTLSSSRTIRKEGKEQELHETTTKNHLQWFRAQVSMIFIFPASIQYLLTLSFGVSSSLT